MTVSAGISPPSSLLLCQIWRQGAGAAPSVNGLRLRHVTQQQSPIINTASPGKWWQVLVKDGGIASNKRIIEVASERQSALD